jgi:predicted RNase H-like HicB family nuclease
LTNGLAILHHLGVTGRRLRGHKKILEQAHFKDVNAKRKDAVHAADGLLITALQGSWLVKKYKIVVEKHPDGYVAYPLGLKGVVVGQGDTYEEALADVRSAVRFHMETFGENVLEGDPPVLEAFVAEAQVEA